jgi:hypothetical protein
MIATHHLIEAKELDARSGDGIEVQLLWYPATDTVTVTVFDTTHCDRFEFAGEHDKALDAFHHPFAHAAFRGIAYAIPLRAHDEPQPLSA